ncbi:TetR/AcrR family transcriptional regulator [Nocardia vaccinii]|uniref:TetR/AcrR family transcriptional regulator n=1 Tax=Nocardia vaccinii TaxID=1822 RepID=UPI000834CD34|nr:TetR/AcrR family transcriptional regulator [Nocardia vaccinii]
MTRNRYHHGDLRAVLLAEAAEQIAAEGIDAVSLRALAQRAGVSHAAPAHHFGNRQGMLTELAIEGFGLLADELHSAGADFREVAIAYIRFARVRPGHFEVMFRHDLLDTGNEQLIAARTRSGAYLREGVAGTGVPPERRRDVELAAWSLVHGYASLWREGALADSRLGEGDPEELARRMLATVEFG